MKIPRRRFLRLVGTIATLSAGTDNGIAQNFPARPITMIGPTPAGGAHGTGVTARYRAGASPTTRRVPP
jgi:tripartite-type tricarboxylate transporter receptor subunit TctC